MIFSSNSGNHVSISPGPLYTSINSSSRRGIELLVCNTAVKTKRVYHCGRNSLVYQGTLQTPVRWRRVGSTSSIQAQNRHKIFLSEWTFDIFSGPCDQLPWRACQWMINKINSMWWSLWHGMKILKWYWWCTKHPRREIKDHISR